MCHGISNKVCNEFLPTRERGKRRVQVRTCVCYFYKHLPVGNYRILRSRIIGLSYRAVRTSTKYQVSYVLCVKLKIVNGDYGDHSILFLPLSLPLQYTCLVLFVANLSPICLILSGTADWKYLSSFISVTLLSVCSYRFG